jgi:hypothetical protein
MQPFHDHKEFFNSPVLTGDQDPYEIIKAYFNDREMYEVRIRLWNLVETALCSPNIQYHEPAERQHLIFFYGQLEGLIEAALKISIQIKEKLTPIQEIE